jgi:AcrR family transcriptional regulator
MEQAMLEQPVRGRGRPRDLEKDAAIRDAAWEVLADKGYEGLTFEAVAEMTGCSRATLYRRFASKLELVETILFETSRAVEPEIASGEPPRDILIAHASACAEYMSGSRGRAILSITESAARLPELDRATLRHMASEQEYYYREFRRLMPGAGAEVLAFTFDTLVGNVIYHVAIRRRALAASDIALLVDQAIAVLHARCSAQEVDRR